MCDYVDEIIDRYTQEDDAIGYYIVSNAQPCKSYHNNHTFIAYRVRCGIL
jgi:hypothetical protein